MATLWFHPATGNDTTGTGSAAAPYKTPLGAVNYLKAAGLQGQQWEIKAQAPGKIRTSVHLAGLFPGGTGLVGQVQIIGAPDIASVKNYVWSPMPGQTALSVTQGAVIWVEGFFFDARDAIVEGGPGSSRILINSGTNSVVQSKNLGFGLVEYSSAYINAQDHGRHQHFGDLLIEVPTATATGVMTAGSRDVAISLYAGQLPLGPGCGVRGPGIQPGSYVASVNGGAIKLSLPATVTDSQVLTFSGGCSAPFGIGQQSIMLNGNWNAPGSGLTLIKGVPHFLFGLLNADQGGGIDWGSLIVNPDTLTTQTVTGVAGATEMTILAPNPDWVAVGYYAHGPAIQFATKVIAKTGAVVTLDKPLIAAPTTARFAHLPPTIGPKLTAWGLSWIKPPDRDAAHLPGDMPIVEQELPVRGGVCQGSKALMW